MKNIAGFGFVVLMTVLLAAGCGEEGPGMGEVDDGGEADVTGKVDMGSDMKAVDGGGGGNGECVIFYNKTGYADPCQAEGKYCQSQEISEFVSNQKNIGEANGEPADSTKRKMTGICTTDCMYYEGDAKRTAAFGTECGQPGLICKLILNHTNVKHPLCRGN